VFTTTVVVCVGAVLLVIAASVPAPRKPGAAGAVLWLLAAVVGGAFVVGTGVEAGGWVADTRPSERAKYVLERLEQPKEKNVLLIDGGSFAARGISDQALEKALEDLGYSVRVVHMGMGGANHFERLTMYRRIVDRLEPRQDKTQRWIYLAEVHKQYDSDPLAQFVKNSDTVRARDYMTPRTAWHALRALEAPDVKAPAEPWRVRFAAFRNALASAFNAGIASRMVGWDEIDASSGYSPEPRSAKYRFTGLGPVLAQLRRPSKPAVSPWVFDIRAKEERKIWGEHLDRWVYFGLPSTLPRQLAHVMAFCKKTDRKCISPNDPALLRRLNKSEHWGDKSHLSPSGAQIYSEWLAKELRRTGLLAR
jgi:hypothetical protein